MSSEYNLARNIAISMYQNELKQNGDHEYALQKAVDFAVAGIPIVNREVLMNDLRASLNIRIDDIQILDAKEHKPWLDEHKTKIKWTHWNRYRRYLLESKHWDLPVVQSIDRSTDRILERLENPIEKSRPFDVRGLVMGYVQSGKTANYTGLINKAVDAGYKLIIVLAGMHNNLRCQTQARLDEELLGFETSTEKSTIHKGKRIGVSLLPGEENSFYVAPLTSRDEKGDFKTTVGRNIGVQPTAQPYILVVKKNATILANILKYFRNDSYLAEEVPGRKTKVVKNVPLLIIDDEADQASVNTNEIEDEEGTLLSDYDPSKINKRIREIMVTFEQKAYVGYTATPFANILIHPEAPHEKYGEDLFPRSFIMNLPQPSNYSGPSELFGLTGDDDEQPLIRKVKDEEMLIPTKERRNKDYDPEMLNDSLKEAIQAFILSTAIRRARGQKKKHNSMLIHVTRYNTVQLRIKELVEEEVVEIRRLIRYGDGTEQNMIKLELKTLWERDFKLTTMKLQATNDEWIDIEKELLPTVESMKVKTINGTAGDILDYQDNSQGLNVIAVGGDKLSRGLTLEGLTISYYLRASKMYDTLMQMGRWFGYRNGYEDVCRIYTTGSLITWFKHVAEATEELREEFEMMATQGATPEQFGLKIKSHPAMIVTNRAKMRNGVTLSLSFAGTISETTAIDITEKALDKNFAVAESFIRLLDSAYAGASEKGHIKWQDVDPKHVVDFLKEYETAATAVKADSKLIAKYIEKQAAKGELTKWIVVLISIKNGKPIQIGSHTIGKSERSIRQDVIKGTINIGKLISGDHQLLDFTEDELEHFKQKGIAKNYKLIRGEKPSHKGLLLIYPVDVIIKQEDVQQGKFNSETIERVDAVKQTPIGIGIVFPGSETAEKVDYVVNPVYLENNEYEL